MLKSTGINIATLVDGASSKLDSSARVVVVRCGEHVSEYFELEFVFVPLLISAENLNAFFTDMKHMLSLEELSVELPVDCSCIAWPDLSRLRVLHLEIRKERNWKLNCILPLLKLDTLRITNSMFSSIGCMLSLEDCIAVGEMLSPSRCPKSLQIRTHTT